MTTAIDLLAAARRANPGRPEGVAVLATTKGAVIVAWNRITRTYEVGTEAEVVATGKRADVLPALKRLMGEEQAGMGAHQPTVRQPGGLPDNSRRSQGSLGAGMSAKPRYNRKGWVLGQCKQCGRQNYVEPHGTTAKCACSQVPTEHEPVQPRNVWD